MPPPKNPEQLRNPEGQDNQVPGAERTESLPVNTEKAERLLAEIKNLRAKAEAARKEALKRYQEIQRPDVTLADYVAGKAEKAAQNVDEALRAMQKNRDQLSALTRQHETDDNLVLILREADTELLFARLAKQSADFNASNAGELASKMTAAAEVRARTPQEEALEQARSAREGILAASKRAMAASTLPDEEAAKIEREERDIEQQHAKNAAQAAQINPAAAEVAQAAARLAEVAGYDTTKKTFAENLAQAQKDFDEAFAKTTELTAMRPGTKEAQKAWQEYDLAEQNLKEAKRLAANPAEYAERVAKLEKRQLTPAQKLAKTRKFIEGKTGKYAELIKQRLNVDLATKKPEEAEAAVKKLQAALGMSEKDQDGILGKKTFNRLAALAALETPKQKPADSTIRDLAKNLSGHINTIEKNYNIAKTINGQKHKSADDIIRLNTAMQTVSDELKTVNGLAKHWTRTYELPSNFSVKMIGLSPVALTTDMKQFDVVQAFGGTSGMLQYAKMSREWESQLAAAKKSYRTVIDSVAEEFVTSAGVIQEPELQARLDELAPENGHISWTILAAGKDNEQFRKDVQAKTKNISIAILNPASRPAAEAAATDATGL